MRTLRLTGPLLVFGLAVGAALFVLGAPTLPQWGERHTPHLHKLPLPLSSGATVEQSFRFEEETLDLVVLWVDQSSPLPKTGDLALEVAAGGETRAHRLPLSSLPSSGVAVFSVMPRLTAPADGRGALRVRLTDEGQRIALQYQIASGIYQDGDLSLNGRPKQGDLAFQLRYRRPALGALGLQWAFAAALVIAGGVVAWLLRPSPIRPTPAQPGARGDGRIALFLGLAVAALYGWFLLHPGFWIGPTDFSKDAAYLASAADALRAGAWPTWSHRTCGGMALLGNPEGNTVSLGTLLAVVLPPDRALSLLLAIEGGLAAAGTYVLARTLSLSRVASVAAAAIASLSAAYPYRIIEGLTPVGGAVALAPWAFLAYLHALRSRSGPWAVVSGTAFAAMFLRGDVHVVVGALLVLATVSLVLTVQRRSWLPLALLGGVGATMFLWSSIKLLPYLEQPELINARLPPYVVPVVRSGVLDDVLLSTPHRSRTIQPLHDEGEEAWGNIGATVGILPLVLGGIGLLTRHPSKAFIIAGAAAAFLISEGTLFDAVLRHVGPLGSLLRVPSRVFSVFVIFWGLLAGLGLDRIRQDLAGRVRRLVPAALLLGVVLTVGAATWTVFRENLYWDQSPAPITPDGPTQAPHANRTPEDPAASRHPTKLLRAGFLLPKICGDQNNPPIFVKELKSDVPLATVPSELRPNRILLSAPAGPADITVRERFTSSWTVSKGTVLEYPDGSLHVVLPKMDPTTIEVRYRDPLARAEQALFLLFLTTLVLLVTMAFRRGHAPSS